MHSLDWSDRNKTPFLIEDFTKSRNPEVLKELCAGILTPLAEQVQWPSFGHTTAAIEALGRIVGFPEERINRVILTHDVGPLLAAAKRPER